MGNLGVFTQGFRPKKEVDLFVTYFELRGMLVYDKQGVRIFGGAGQVLVRIPITSQFF